MPPAAGRQRQESTGLECLPVPWPGADAGYGHKVPLRGGTKLSRYLSTAELMHELPIM
jgi:hypothetical protein